MIRMSVVLVVALALAACGGGDDDVGDAATAPAPAASSEVEASEEPDDPEDQEASGAAGATDAAGDQAIAEEAVLQLSDFGPGWRADEAEEEEDEGDIDECEGFEKFADDEIPSADSKTFVRDEAEVESSVAVVATEAEAEEFMRLLVSDSTATCLRRVLQEAVEEGLVKDPDLSAQFDGVSAELGALSVDPYGDEAAGYQAQLTFEGEAELDLFFDLVIVRQGRALALFSFFDVFAPFADDRAPLVGAVVDRLEAAGV